MFPADRDEEHRHHERRCEQDAKADQHAELRKAGAAAEDMQRKACGRSQRTEDHARLLRRSARAIAACESRPASRSIS